MDIEKGISKINEFEKARFELLEMPTQKLLEDFLKGAFGEAEVTVIFNVEEGKFVELPKESK